MHIISEGLHETICNAAMARKSVLTDRSVCSTDDVERTSLALRLRFEHHDIRMVIVEVVFPNDGLFPWLVKIYEISERNGSGVDSLYIFKYKPTCCVFVAVDDMERALSHGHIKAGALSIAAIEPGKLRYAVTISPLDLIE